MIMLLAIVGTLSLIALTYLGACIYFGADLP